MEKPMLTRIMAMMMAATLVAASPVFAQGSNNTNPRRSFGNFGPTSDAVGRANPGNQARERPTDPSQFRSLPGFVAPSQSQPHPFFQTARVKRLDDDCLRIALT